MPRRKSRIRVCLDTNVVVAFYQSRNTKSPIHQIFRLWRDLRLIQVIVSEELFAEYVEVLRRYGISPQLIARFEERFRSRGTVTWVRTGAKRLVSRDSDDDLVLATAVAGRVDYLVTGDRDLLDLPDDAKRRYRFVVCTPAAFMDSAKEATSS